MWTRKGPGETGGTEHDLTREAHGRAPAGGHAPGVKTAAVLVAVSWIGAIGLALGTEIAVAATFFVMGLRMMEAFWRVALKVSSPTASPSEDAVPGRARAQVRPHR